MKLFNVLCVYSRSWIPTQGMETDVLIESMMAEGSTSTIRRVANGVVETTSSADEDLIDINTEARFDYPVIADKSHGKYLRIYAAFGAFCVRRKKSGNFPPHRLKLS